MCHAMSHRFPQRAAGQRGVTLVELMVGMLIGMLAILVISQVLLVSEGQKRTTTSGADAQVNGALSLFTIQRDIQAAGYGFTSSPGIVGCPLNARYNGAAPAGFPAVLAPVFITPEAARPLGSVGDSIRILSSSKTSYSVPTRVVPPGIAVAGQSVAVAAALGFAVGDVAVVAADGVQPCWVFEVTAGLTATQLPRVDNARWNTAGTPTQAYGDGSVVLNLGTLIDNRYEINVVNGVNVLQVSSLGLDVNTRAPTWTTRDVQAGVVGLMAFYGRDTSAPNDGIVDVYDTTTPANNAAWLRVMSVRLLVVSRSGQYEKDIVTPANPTWEVGATPPTTGSAACGASQCVTIDVGADAAGDVEAKHYRYKVFETIVPMRNMMWSS
jgi:type IV pilus assembly protein PilW